MRCVRLVLAAAVVLLVPACGEGGSSSALPFVLVLPAAGATGVSTQPTFTWNPSFNAISYRLEVSTTAAFTVLAINRPGLTGLSDTPPGTLLPGTVYFWRVTAAHSLGPPVLAGGSPATFTTLPVPGGFNAQTPLNGAANVPLLPLFSWSVSSAAATYTLEVATDLGFGAVVLTETDISTTSFTPSAALAGSTLHYWRVTAVNGSGTRVMNGASPSFTTTAGPPGAFTLSAPANGAVDVSTTPAYSWTAASGAATYTLQVSTSAAFASFVVDEAGLVGTGHSPSVALGTSTTYFWRVTAVNASGSTLATGAPASFTTGPPAAFSLSSTGLTFMASAGGANPAAQDVQITNPSGLSTPLQWTVSSDRPWLQVGTWFGSTTTETDLLSVNAVISQAEAWTTDTSVVGAPLDREDFALVWTGREMIVWGGTTGAGRTNTGGRYDPAADTWSAPMSTVGAPTARRGQTGVWTGTEMIVWGGSDASGLQADGYRYNPRTDTWSGPIATNPGFAGRAAHSAVWTGTEMIIWGGVTAGGLTNDGARYNPASNAWQGMSTSAFATTREHHVAVWTGTEMIMWGGQFGTTRLNTGARYDPGTNTWTAATSTTGAPDPAAGASAVWSGTEMIVWGGLPQMGAATNAGGRYDPGTGAWLGATTLTNAPVARRSHEAVWIGGEMIAWGGYDGGAFHQEGRRYRPPIALAAGTYVGTLTLTDPDASNSPRTISVTLTVTP